jgi:hypothetical protein
MEESSWKSLFTEILHEDGLYGCCASYDDTLDVVREFSYSTSTTYVITRTTKTFGSYNSEGNLITCKNNMI